MGYCLWGEEWQDIDEGEEDEDVLRGSRVLRLAIRRSARNISGLDAVKRSKVTSDADGEWEDIDEEAEAKRAAQIMRGTDRSGAKSQGVVFEMEDNARFVVVVVVLLLLLAMGRARRRRMEKVAVSFWVVLTDFY